MRINNSKRNKSRIDIYIFYSDFTASKSEEWAESVIIGAFLILLSIKFIFNFYLFLLYVLNSRKFHMDSRIYFLFYLVSHLTYILSVIFEIDFGRKDDYNQGLWRTIVFNWCIIIITINFWVIIMIVWIIILEIKRRWVWNIWITI